MQIIKKKIDIDYYAKQYILDGLNKKKLLFEFLENNNINDFIADKIWFMEHLNLNNDIYTYWIDGGLSWYYTLKNNNFTEEEKINMIICNLKIHYLFININECKNKLKDIYNLTVLLQNFIKSTINIDTEIITTNFVYENNKFIYYPNSQNNYIDIKENILNIKLVLKTNIKGGQNNLSNSSSLIDFKPGIFSIENLPLINNKIAVEFNLEYLNTLSSLSNFNNNYITIPKNKVYKENENSLTLRKKLNRLNIIGLLTISYLNIIRIEDETRLNIEEIRQNIFKKYYLDTSEKFLNFYENIINIYKTVFKVHHPVFLQKIYTLIINYKFPFYTKYVETINKYYICKFKPILNSYIKTLNNDLHHFNTKLFIKGGESMRRYDKNISVTNDIDTKIYYNNNYDEILKIIIKNTFKLRCYFEDNKLFLFNDINIFDFKFGNYLFSIQNFKNIIQNFVTRCITINRNPDFRSIDLLGIGLNYFINITDISDSNNPIITNVLYNMLGILDVDIEYNNNNISFNKYYKIFDGIPIATLDFLINDIEKMYMNLDVELRIINNKFIKDIVRYNKLIDIYNLNNISSYDEYNNIKNITGLSDDIMIFINKYKNSISFNLKDYILIRKLLTNNEKLEEISKYPILLSFFTDIYNFDINLPNEKINSTDFNYFKFNYYKSKNPIVTKYLSFYKQYNYDYNILIKNFNFFFKYPNKNSFFDNRINNNINGIIKKNKIINKDRIIDNNKIINKTRIINKNIDNNKIINKTRIINKNIDNNKIINNNIDNNKNRIIKKTRIINKDRIINKISNNNIDNNKNRIINKDKIIDKDRIINKDKNILKK